MKDNVSLDKLWALAPASKEQFTPEHVNGLPETARRYLTHAIAPGTPLASAVRLRMHGEIKLVRWFPFEAEQVIQWQRGMIWKATAHVFGLPIHGFDRIADGEGAMQWKLLGLIPLITADGPNISRSAAGRLHVETSTWLPSAFCMEGATFTTSDRSHATGRIQTPHHADEITLTVDKGGKLDAISMQRWGDPDGGGFRQERFGGLVEEEGTFGGFTIPTRLRVGWYFGTERFESEGEFFRGVVDEAIYK